MSWQQLLLGTFLVADGDLMEWMDPQIDAVVQRPTKVTPKRPVISAEYVLGGSASGSRSQPKAATVTPKRIAAVSVALRHDYCEKVQRTLPPL